MPDTTTAFDIETFNESTLVFWDVAHASGYHAGELAGSGRVARDYTKIMLGLAEMYLEVALRPGNEDLDGDIIRVRRILCQTPMLVPQVQQAVMLTDRTPIQNLSLAHEAVKDGLKALS